MTTNMDIAAWAMVAIGAEPYIVSALGTYMPLLLEQLARSNGVSPIDHLTPCIPSPDEPIAGQPPSMVFTEQMACVLPILGGSYYIDTSSYALYTFSVAVLLQTICVMTISGIADNSNNKKMLLVGVGSLGGLLTSLFIFVGGHSYYLASILAILANCAFGVVNVLINSYMMLLINNYKLSNEELPLVQENDEAFEHRLGKIGAKISGIGTSSGYSSALLVQVLSLFSLITLKKKYDDIIWCTKIVISCVGLWWLFWQIPIMKYLRNFSTEDDNKKLTYSQMIGKGYHDIYHAIKSVGELKHVYFFLLGWFFLADSVTTINSTAMLFAKTTLNMPMVSIAFMGILVMISAICGSVVIPQFIVAKCKFDLQHVLIGIILWSLMVPIYGLFFLRHPWELFLLAVWYGIGLGGLSTVSRSIYSLIIPKGKENVFFALFSLTDKSSSIVGPFLVGMVIDVLHDLRMAFWILAGLMILSLPIIGMKFDLHSGRQHAATFH